VDAPEGYAVHRQERAAINFARSVSLPCQVDTDKVAAHVKDGLLTVTMEKSKEAQPRQITIKAS
jgi:HSP20 family protein